MTARRHLAPTPGRYRPCRWGWTRGPGGVDEGLDVPACRWGWTARPRPGIRVLPCPFYAPWVGWSGLWRVCMRLLIDGGESRLVLVASCQVVSKRLALV